MAQLYKVDSPITREQRQNLNETFEDILRKFNNVNYQISILAGGTDVEELIKRIEDTIQNAIVATSNMEDDVSNAIDDMNTTINDAVTNMTNQINADLARLQTLIDNGQVILSASQMATAEAVNTTALAQQTINEMRSIMDDLHATGEWNATTQYYMNNLVGYDGDTYIALQDSLGQPISDGGYWALFASKGEKGERGEKGETGTGINLKGVKESVDDLPLTDNEEGDAYTVNGSIYVWDGTAWQDGGNIKGEKGDKGDKGEKGDTGEKGNDGVTPDMTPIYTAIATVEGIANTNATNIGDLTTLTTTDKTNLVSALNSHLENPNAHPLYGTVLDLRSTESGIDTIVLGLNRVVDSNITNGTIVSFYLTETQQSQLDAINGSKFIQLNDSQSTPILLCKADGENLNDFERQGIFTFIYDDVKGFFLSENNSGGGGGSGAGWVVQKGEVKTLPSNNVTIDIDISEVDLTRSIIIHDVQSANNTTTPDVLEFSVTFISSTKFRLRRGAINTGDVTVRWQVIQFPVGYRVFSGTTVLSGGASVVDASLLNIPIGDYSKAVLLHSQYLVGTGTDYRLVPSGYLTPDTQKINFRRSIVNQGVYTTISWFIVVSP